VLIALDGTESFCSGNIHFSQCEAAAQQRQD
jgi:hypothetical protein